MSGRVWAFSAAVGLVVLLSGCTHVTRFARLEKVDYVNQPANENPGHVRAFVEGRKWGWSLFSIPISTPVLTEAVDDALRGTSATVLEDVEISKDNYYFPFLFNIHRIRVKGYAVLKN